MSTPFAPPHQPKTSRPCGPDLGFPFSTDPASTFHPDTLLAEKYPQLKAAVKAKDWQSVLELGGAGVADAAMFYGAGKHALGNALGIPADIAASLLSQIILYNAGPCRE